MRNVSRSVPAAACLASLLALAAGVASGATNAVKQAGPTSAGEATQPPPAVRKKHRKRLVVLDTSPEHPIAGQNYTMTFAVVRGDEPFPYMRFGCYARTKAGTVPLVEHEGNGKVAHCTWAIPKNARGLTLNGIISVRDANDVQWFLGFHAPIS